MDHVSSFLETSTIHGFSHIATSKRFARVFWIFVVCFGFLGAVFLINSSFEAWNVSPVNTIIETQSIKGLEFPKVAVCPPRNTYTNLNYDILNANHTSRLDESAISLIINTTVAKMQELEAEVATANFFEDENRFRNWYYKFDKSFKKFPESNFIQTSYLVEVSSVVNVFRTKFLFIKRDTFLHHITKRHLMSPHFPGFMNTNLVGDLKNNIEKLIKFI